MKGERKREAAVEVGAGTRERADVNNGDEEGVRRVPVDWESTSARHEVHRCTTASPPGLTLPSCRRHAVCQAREEQVLAYATETEPGSGLQTSRLGLLLRVTADLWRRRQQLHVRCSAALVLTFTFDAVRLLPPSSSWDQQQSSASAVLRTPEAPVISGPGLTLSRSRSRDSLRVGDWLALNCSTSADDVHLKWFINNEEVRTCLPHTSPSCLSLSAHARRPDRSTRKST